MGSVERLRVLSLFAGIGGIDLGLERTGGFETTAFVERDDYCRAVLRKHWPHVPQHADVRDFHAEEGQFDVIAGGFPCQPVSLAGRRKAQADERWLWPEFARLVGEIRPRWVLAENVPGLAFRGLGDVLASLAALGFDAEWDVVPARAVGAPHLRERILLVAYPGWESGSDSVCERLQESSQRDGESDAGSEVPLRADADRLRDALADAERHAIRAGLRRLESTARASAGEAQERQRVRLDALDGRAGRRVFGRQPEAEWLPEPNVGRVANGIPSRLDRLRALGNAVVPQVAEFVGELILEAERRAWAA